MPLQDDINNFGTANTASDLVVLAACIANTTTSRCITVANVNALPDLSQGNVDPGTIVFVENLGVPVISHVGCWTGLDNREIRNDSAVTLLYAWGYNTPAGSLGDGTTTIRSSPTLTASTFNNWTQVSSSMFAAPATLAVRSNGTLWGWGCNSDGKIGDCTTTNRCSPVSVVGGFTDWRQASTARFASHGVRANGTLWAWGRSYQGVLGDNSLNLCRSSPVSVVGGFTDWCRVSTNYRHAAALRTNCSLWVWGFNNYGTLGNNTTTGTSSPVSVVGGFTDWCQLSTGMDFTVAVRTNCTLWAWGRNQYGKLGDGTSANKSSPVSVVGGFTDWCTTAAGCHHALAIRTGGSLWAWGQASYGKLGNNSTLVRCSPVSVVGGFTDWCQVGAGYNHSLAVRTNGTVWAWGRNAQREVGDGTASGRSSPVSVLGGITNFCSVSGGLAASFAIRNL